MNSRRPLSLEVSLVVMSAPVVLEPIDQHLEWSLVLLMEVESFRSDLDEFLQDLLLWHVTENDVLRVSWKNGKAIWNSLRCLFLLFLQSLLHVLKCFSV